MKHLKKILVVALVVMLTICLTSAWFRRKPKEATVKLLWWGSQSRHDKTLKVIDMFKAKYPKIKVEPTYTSWGSYWEKLATLAAGGDMPDVCQMTIQNLPLYNEKGLLADINKIKTVNKGAIDKSAVDIGKISGKLMGICLGANAYTLVYNPDLFKKAGVPEPNEKWTWADVEKNGKILKDKLDIYALGNVPDNSFEYWCRINDETMFADSLKAVGFSEKTLVDYFAINDKLHKSGIMEPRKIAVETKSNEENSPYAKGKCAMRFLWSNKVVGVVKTLGRTSQLTTYPGGPKGSYVKPSMFFSIGKPSKVKDQAGTFVNFFVSDIEANKVLNADRGVPVVASVRKALAPGLDEQNKIIWDFVEMVGKFQAKGMDLQFPNAYKECVRSLNGTLEKVYYEKITPEDGAKEVIKNWTAILNK